MTGSMGSRAIVKTQVYAQDTQPSDERDGVLWVDTSVSPRQTHVYSTDSGSWEAVTPSQTNQTVIPGGWDTSGNGETWWNGDITDGPSFGGTKQFDLTGEYEGYAAVDVRFYIDSNTDSCTIRAVATDGETYERTNISGNGWYRIQLPGAIEVDRWEVTEEGGNYGMKCFEIQPFSPRTAAHDHTL